MIPRRMLAILERDLIRVYGRDLSIRTLGKALFNPAVRAVLLVRASQSCKPFWYLLRGRLRRAYGIQVAQSAEIEGGLYLPHPLGIVICEGALVREGATIFQGATIALRHGEAPILAKDVTLLPGCVVAGGVTVGAGATVGANTYVDRDVPPKSLAIRGGDLTFRGQG